MSMKTHLLFLDLLVGSLLMFSCKDDSRATTTTIPPTLSQEARLLRAGLKVIGGTPQSQVYRLPPEKSDPTGFFTETTITSFENAVKQPGSFTSTTVMGVTTYRTSILDPSHKGIQWIIGMDGTNFRAIGRRSVMASCRCFNAVNNGSRGLPDTTKCFSATYLGLPS